MGLMFVVFEHYSLQWFVQRTVAFVILTVYMYTVTTSYRKVRVHEEAKIEKSEKAASRWE